MSRLVLILLGDADDPISEIEKLLDCARVRALDGIGWLLEVDDDDPKRAAAAARQRRYRRRRRDARDSPARDARDAAEDREFSNSGGLIHSLPALSGQEGVSESPNGDAGDASRRDARDGDARDAPATRQQKEAAQAKIRELSEQLRNGRRAEL